MRYMMCVGLVGNPKSNCYTIYLIAPHQCGECIRGYELGLNATLNHRVSADRLSEKDLVADISNPGFWVILRNLRH